MSQAIYPTKLLICSFICVILVAGLATFSHIYVVWGGAICLLLLLAFMVKISPKVTVENKEAIKEQQLQLHAIQQELDLLTQENSTLTEQVQRSKDKQQLYHTVLDLIPDWIYVKDKKHNYIFANKSFLEAIPNLTIGKSDDLFMPADFCEKIWHDEAAVINSGVPITDAEEQAGDVWFSTSKVQWVNNETSQTNGIIGVTRNVTEAVVNRLTVQSHAELIQEKVKRVIAIQEDTSQVRKYAAECAQVVEKMATIITQLNSGNKQIEETIVLIKDLASQSKLLSINARIESAKAGETGRGFGVVANEVRGLAERSEQAVTEIEAAIKSNSQVIDSSTQGMDKTTQAFQVIIEQVEQVASSLDVLTNDLAHIENT